MDGEAAVALRPHGGRAVSAASSEGVRRVTGTGRPGAVWDAATDELADEIVSAQQRAYLRLTRLRAIVEDTALLSVPDAFTRDVIESRLRPAITEALSRQLGRPIQVAVTVRPAGGPATAGAGGARRLCRPHRRRGARRRRRNRAGRPDRRPGRT